ncbi:tRNA (guanine(6)-N2)-methyltransferase THUMP3-like [Oppia nitens]|uniref:tRNA (guanine(6)-N2)-methyltransferase THUMP3-like n=1 Tax=Oppia nitens TaxID=1686743 RepID=UPI0023DA9E0E|nr:tRNA (guanine(6)-N2)-methyltransferase THUMP3-like [Oppia nitens]
MTAAAAESATMTITYEATVGTGCEFIAVEECQQKLSPKTVRQMDGRVFIETDRPVAEVLQLKSCDNIYVVIYDKEFTDDFPAATDSAGDDLRQLLARVSSDCQWESGLRIWSETFGWNKCQLNTILDTNCTADNSELIELKPAFRVTCNRTGSRHKFTSNECASHLGAVINETYRWKVSMKQFDIEVVLTIKDRHLYVGLALTRESLHKRNLVVFGPTSLKSTVAFHMLWMANIQCGDLVCDPMCGSGAIPIECLHNWPTFGLSGDNHPVAVERTQMNNGHNQSLVDVIRFDVRALPLRTNSVDVFCTDLPFGKRLGSKHDNRTLYPALLIELSRCSRAGTGRMVLLTQDKRNMNYSLGNPAVKKYWKIVRTMFVRIGGLDASIFVARRNAVPFE